MEIIHHYLHVYRYASFHDNIVSEWLVVKIRKSILHIFKIIYQFVLDFPYPSNKYPSAFRVNIGISEIGIHGNLGYFCLTQSGVDKGDNMK